MLIPTNYTDDTKTGQGVAFAVYSENFSASKAVSNFIALFTVELYGVLDTTTTA